MKARFAQSNQRLLTLAAGCILAAATLFAITLLDVREASGTAPPPLDKAWFEGVSARAASASANASEPGWAGPVATWDQFDGDASRPSLVAIRSRFSLPLRRWKDISDPFGVPREGGTIHGGIDLDLAGFHASPVYAACNGTVLSSDWSDNYGYHVVVDCGDGWSTLEAHFSQLLVPAGASVAGGTTIVGISGSTGKSTGEHLHFEVHWQGAPIDPESVLDLGRGIRAGQ